MAVRAPYVDIDLSPLVPELTNEALDLAPCSDGEPGGEPPEGLDKPILVSLLAGDRVPLAEPLFSEKAPRGIFLLNTAAVENREVFGRNILLLRALGR